MRPVVIFLHRHKNNRRVQIEKHLPALQQLIQANIFYAVILSGDLGVHIGVYQPLYSVLFSNTCYLIQPNKSRNQFTYLIKDTTLD